MTIVCITVRVVGGGGAPKEKNVGLGLVRHVVNPTLALLNAKVPPLRLGLRWVLGTSLANSLGSITCLYSNFSSKYLSL